MYLPRIYDLLEDQLKKGKVLVLYGPRQVGKTTLLNHFLENTQLKYRLAIGDNIRDQNILSSLDLPNLQEYVQGYEVLIIDEAQKINNIGENLKLLIDHNPNLKIIATGSSSFELAGQIGEPLTGRKKTLTLYPISQYELSKNLNIYDQKSQLPEYLVYGSYPEVLLANTLNEKREMIMEIMESYLLKDILSLEKVKRPKTILKLLQLLSYQVGNEVSLSEIGSQIGINYKTVARYLELLEQSFVIFSLSGFSRNLRKEISKKINTTFLIQVLEMRLLQILIK